MDTYLSRMYSIVFLMLCLMLCSDAELPYSGNGETKEFWNLEAKIELNKARKLKPNIHVAKNVILFLGDGMGVSTVTAARILRGQLQNKTGEEGLLSFEEFPHIGLAKTYNQDLQTPDSAGTATAFLAGIKTNAGVLGLDGRSRKGNCSTATGTEVKSILHWSQKAGKSVGVVTNTRITHATPGAAYAHSPERDWEGDADMVGLPGNCSDISKQLIDDNPDINVIMGGGRRTFLTKDDIDPETGTTDSKGRLDGRNLISVYSAVLGIVTGPWKQAWYILNADMKLENAEGIRKYLSISMCESARDWQQKQEEHGRKFRYVWNRTEFESIEPGNTDYLLGLFNPSHMQYEVDRQTDTGGEPSLAQMTEKAIQILRKNAKGFFLLVEGGRIDHAHHDTKAVRSLHETLAFDDAIQKAVELTDESDTLIVTTADHSHTFTVGGYPSRGNPIFGLADNNENGGLKLADDKKPYSTLGYANGPGSFVSVNATVRPNITLTNMADKDYTFQATVPLDSETHGGEDVAIYSQGPMSHLFHGVHEQHYIAHVMAYASCVGDYQNPDECAAAEINDNSTSHGLQLHKHSLLQILAILVILRLYP